MDLEDTINHTCRTQNYFQKRPTPKRQIYRFSWFFPTIYICQKAKSKKYTLLNHLSALHVSMKCLRVWTLMYVMVTMAWGGGGRNQKLHRGLKKPHKIISFLKREIKHYAFIIFLLLF